MTEDQKPTVFVDRGTGSGHTPGYRKRIRAGISAADISNLHAQIPYEVPTCLDRRRYVENFLNCQGD